MLSAFLDRRGLERSLHIRWLVSGLCGGHAIVIHLSPNLGVETDSLYLKLEAWYICAVYTRPVWGWGGSSAAGQGYYAWGNWAPIPQTVSTCLGRSISVVYSNLGLCVTWGWACWAWGSARPRAEVNKANKATMGAYTRKRSRHLLEMVNIKRISVWWFTTVICWWHLK